ncbi:hypothetical protein ANTQUA_LOCUS3488 [Anthophora quadrimaculata]
MVFARCASNRSIRLVVVEIQDSNPVAYSTWYISLNTSILDLAIDSNSVAYLSWYISRNTSILDLAIVIALKIMLRLFYISITMALARCASNRSFRSVAFEIQDSNPVAYSTWYISLNTSIQDLAIVIVLKIKLRLFYISITMVLARCASNRSFRLVAFEIQDSNPVAYLSWCISGNTLRQDLAIVIAPKIMLRLFYLSITMALARCASNRCIRLVAF